MASSQPARTSRIPALAWLGISFVGIILSVVGLIDSRKDLAGFRAYGQNGKTEELAKSRVRVSWMRLIVQFISYLVGVVSLSADQERPSPRVRAFTIGSLLFILISFNIDTIYTVWAKDRLRRRKARGE